MKLLEKYCELLDTDSGYDNELLASKCEKIADSFAINFANWYEFMLRQSDNLNQRFTPNELINMFKREKGL